MQVKYTQEALKLLRVAEKDHMKYKNNSEYLKFLAFNKIKGADYYTVSLSSDKILSS
jgi:hypothetical protein